MAAQPSPPQRLIRELADVQHGVVARRDLLAHGFTRHQIDARIEAGWLVPVHRGIYRVGSRRMTHRSRWMAALLACGHASVLSHRSAAALWRLVAPSVGPVHVTVTGRTRRLRGVIAHRTRRIERDEVTVRHRIPVTTPPRTLLDLAAILPPTQLRRAFEEAERLELLDRVALRRLCLRTTGRRGIGTLRTLLSERELALSETRSPLEARFLAFCRKRGLPIPAVNVPVNGKIVDCLWPRERVVAELDGWTHHGSRAAFEGDRERDVGIQIAGHRIIRITDRRMTQPDRLEADLRRLLSLEA